MQRFRQLACPLKSHAELVRGENEEMPLRMIFPQDSPACAVLYGLELEVVIYEAFFSISMHLPEY